MIVIEAISLPEMFEAWSNLRGWSSHGSRAGEGGGRCWSRASAWPGGPDRSATQGPGDMDKYSI